ncbi:MAG: type I-E CRISPR-associated protein Cas7/Cse4/CasC [Myxococcota bacterium]
MSTFLQFHLLTSYPPSNLNRDDLGQPKSALLGGVHRIRISSQALKRAWRTSSVFADALSGKLGVRTKRLGCGVYELMVEQGAKDKLAEKVAKTIAGVFGKLKSDKSSDKSRLQHLEVETLVHVTQREFEAAMSLARMCASEGREPSGDELDLLRLDATAADIALFGRMLASRPDVDVDASAQIAHAITVHRAIAENDFFTAVDDLNKGEDDRGSGHMGDHEFSAGVFYLYGCVNTDLLSENLSGDVETARAALEALVEAAATVAPGGMQNSFGSRAYASYCLLEQGTRQPRTLSHAFLEPVGAGDMLAGAVAALDDACAKMDGVYGPVASDRYSFNAITGEGTLEGAKQFAAECIA